MSGSSAKAVRRAARRAEQDVVTHEPDAPLKDWPESHVGVHLTGDDLDECIEIVIHGVTHYLHSSTAQALCSQLIVSLTTWEASAVEQSGHYPPGWSPMAAFLDSYRKS